MKIVKEDTVPRHLTLSDVMTPAPKTIDASARLTEARDMMEELSVNHLPVMDNSVVESILSDRDIKRFTLPAHKIADDEDLLVRDIATGRAFVADGNDSLKAVLPQMVRQRASAVVVLDQGELAGIFTETDACRVLAELLPAGDA